MSRPVASNPLAADLLAGLDPVHTFRTAFHADPFAWQERYLRETRNVAIVKGRQIGASTASAALAIHQALYVPGSVSVIVSPSLKQSAEIQSKARAAIRNLDNPMALDQDSASTIGLSNGSRILSLPGTATSVRGYTASLLIVDESAYVEEDTWLASRALVATGGRVCVLSTPAGRSGWFWELAESDDRSWTRFKVKSEEVPTISREYLASERRAMGPWKFAMEFEAEFGSGGASLFDHDRLMGLVDHTIKPLFGAREEA